MKQGQRVHARLPDHLARDIGCAQQFHRDAECFGRLFGVQQPQAVIRQGLVLVHRGNCPRPVQNEAADTHLHRARQPMV